MTGRRLISLTLTILAILAVPGVALASWVEAGSGSASAGAVDMPAGPTPVVNATGRTVNVSWATARFPDTTAVSAYLVTRYDTGGVVQSIGAGCSGEITALTCTESSVPAGSWVYTVTAKQGGWTGPESDESSPVTVESASLSFSSSTSISALPTTLSGTVANFLPGETLTFRLDNPTSGTSLTKTVTPSPIPASGSAAITVTIPVGTVGGNHTVYAVGSSGSQAGAGIAVFPNDTVAPTVSRAIIVKSAGGVGGSIKQGGQYYAYANVSDGGATPTGVATVRANVSAITTSATNLTMTAGSYTIQGLSYNYRTSSQTAAGSLSAGTRSFTITATDVAGNGGSSGFSVVVDNTAPAGVDVQTTNVGGGTNGKAETGDTISLTYTEAMDPYRIISTWTGAATTVTLRLVQSGSGDRVQITNASTGATLRLGTVYLNRTDYTTSTVSFSNSTMVMSGSTITITLGTPSGSTTTAASTGTMTWNPSGSATDNAGNTCATTTKTETGAVDKDF